MKRVGQSESRYEPSESEILQKCAEIRRQWSEVQHISRAGSNSPQPFSLITIAMENGASTALPRCVVIWNVSCALTSAKFCQNLSRMPFGHREVSSSRIHGEAAAEHLPLEEVAHRHRGDGVAAALPYRYLVPLELAQRESPWSPKQSNPRQEAIGTASGRLVKRLNQGRLVGRVAQY